jgi:uncharacterized membrane protein
MNTFIRLIRHLLTTSASGRRAFPTATLQVIEQRIAEGESQHRAEIRLIVEPSLPLGSVLRRITSRERALALFAQYGIWDTEENCGMLVYINMADHKIEIVTDRGIGKKVAAEVWQAICNDMTQGFKQDAYLDSTLAALGKINALLQQHFPATGSRINQLPNRPLML